MSTLIHADAQLRCMRSEADKRCVSFCFIALLQYLCKEYVYVVHFACCVCHISFQQ
jgi:hypothetical protein